MRSEDAVRGKGVMQGEMQLELAGEGDDGWVHGCCREDVRFKKVSEREKALQEREK